METEYGHSIFKINECETQNTHYEQQSTNYICRPKTHEKIKQL